MTIFEKIKQIRKSKSITLKEMSKRNGISVNYLSQIERGASNPSIGILKKISNVLDVPIMGLNTQSSNANTNEAFKQDQKVAVVRKNMRKMLVFPKSKLKQYLLTPDLQRKLEVLLGEVDPGEEHEEEWYSHEGEEFGFVVSGGIELSLGGKTYRVKRGECFYFRASKRHHIANRRKSRALVLWVSSPPNF